MNGYLVVDALGYLDEELLAEHLEKKEELRRKARIKRIHRMWRTAGAAAACICLAALIAWPLRSGNGNDVGDTSLQPYEEIAQIIGHDTLLKNIDFSDMENHSIKIFYRDGSTERYEKLEFIANTAKYSYELNINFNTNGNAGGYYKAGTFEMIKGVGVAINKIEISPDSIQYVARFEYNDCQYTVKSLDNISEEDFYDLLNEILG